MNCRDIKRNMSAYLDGELPDTGHAAFFDHLADCEACCDMVGEASYAEAALAGTLKQPMHAPASLRYNVLSALSQEKARPMVPVWQRFAWRPAAAMAAVLALAGTGWRTFTAEAPSYQPVSAQVPPSEPAAGRQPYAPPKAEPRPAAPPLLARAPVETPAPKALPGPAPSAVKAPPAPKRPTAPPVAVPRTPVAPREVAPSVPPTADTDSSIGSVRYAWGADLNMNARLLSKPEGGGEWTEADTDVRVRTLLKTAEDTIVALQLKDGTALKSNQHTEFVILRSPTKEDPTWAIRLVRGELWVGAAAPVRVEAPGLSVDALPGEFSVRSTDGEDASVTVLQGRVACRNERGAVDVPAGHATSVAAGEAPAEPFTVAEPKALLGWAYDPEPAFDPLGDAS